MTEPEQAAVPTREKVAKALAWFREDPEKRIRWITFPPMGLPGNPQEHATVLVRAALAGAVPDTGQASEPGIAERAAKLGAAVGQERADQLATGLMALADDMRSMAGQWPDNAAARNAYGVAEMRARNLVAADRETENHFRPEPAADTVQACKPAERGCQAQIAPSWANSWVTCGYAVRNGKCVKYGHEQGADTTPEAGRA